MKKLTIATVAALLAASSADAQDRSGQVDAIFAFATVATPGCAVGVSQQNRVVLNRAYGLANVERRLPLSGSSLFDIGSTQKQFTAAAILLLVEDGRLSLSDDIRKYLPELPDYGHKVTVDNLLTHTGGIRDWTGLLPLAPEGTTVLQLILRQRGLNFVPGTEWSYSNSGYELAKEIVGRVSGMSFADFTRRRIFEPLGMRATAYVPDILQAGENAAIGYQKDGNSWRPFMRLGNNRGGGAIVSTIGDLLTWQDALATGKLGAAVTGSLHEQTRLTNGRKLNYARGVIVDSTPGGVVISHSGGAAGFSTWMGRVPEHNLSVAVSCNFDPVSATNLAGRVIDEVFLPPVDSQTLALWRAQRPVAAPGIDVTGREGLFFEERTGEPMRLAVNNGRLMIVNGPPLVPVSATAFRLPRPTMSGDDFVLTFADADHVEIKSREGEITRYRRARPHTPTAAELQALGGRYESTELGSAFEVVPGSNSLTIRAEHARDRTIEVTPVERDTYMYRMMLVRFRREANGRVTGFDYSNPVAKGIQFTRVGEHAVAAADSARPSPPASQNPATAPAADAPSLEALTGEYQLEPGRTVTITLEGGRLHGQPSGGQKRALAHVSGTTFSVAGSPMTLTFTLDAEGNATTAVMSQSGRERILLKVR